MLYSVILHLNTSKTSETNAKTSETNAKTSETNAKTSETNAKTSEVATETARDQVQQMINCAGEQSTLVVFAQRDGFKNVGQVPSFSALRSFTTLYILNLPELFVNITAISLIESE